MATVNLHPRQSGNETYERVAMATSQPTQTVNKMADERLIQCRNLARSLINSVYMYMFMYE